MQKADITAILIKEGWICFQVPTSKEPYLLVHPTSKICYRPSIMYPPGKSFFVPTKHFKSMPATRASTIHTGEPSVSRYIGVGNWSRFRDDPALKLLIDTDNFMAISYAV